MAPVRSSTRQSSASAARTPPRGVARITQGQKQALIDNLQLEVTERARKLRAQYALQAQGLRSRVELRVNRIPTSLRKVNLAELIDKYANTTKTTTMAPPARAATKASTKQPLDLSKSRSVLSPGPPRGMKRHSDAISGADKENTPDPSQGVPNPTKRSKAGPAPSGRAAPSASTVLSPKSSNARTMPATSGRAPFGAHKSTNVDPSTTASPRKHTSPIKAATATATSMLASMVSEKTHGVAKAAAASTTASAAPAAAATAGRKGAKTTTATAGARAKREPAVSRVLSSSSNTSGTSTASTGTTIVKRVGRALNVGGGGAAKKTAATSRKAAPAAKAKSEAPAASATGRRVLRKRA